jgi:hypothetical protein
MTRDLLALPRGDLRLLDFQRRLPDALGGSRPEAEPS